MISNKTIQFLIGAAAFLQSVRGESSSYPAQKLYPSNSCCDKDDFIQCFIGDAKCCSDSTWICPNGMDGSYTCPGDDPRAYTRGAAKTAIASPGKPCVAFPQEYQCTDDVFQCADGSYVSRDPQNGCAFRPCPPSGDACREDLLRCPDGSVVSRDPTNKCKFPPCPISVPTPAPPSGECCDLDQFPLCLIGTAKCCPDGTWRCPDGNTGTSNCRGYSTTKTAAFGKPCANPAKKGGFGTALNSP